MGIQKAYSTAVARYGQAEDAAQLRVVSALQKLQDQLLHDATLAGRLRRLLRRVRTWLSAVVAASAHARGRAIQRRSMSAILVHEQLAHLQSWMATMTVLVSAAVERSERVVRAWK